MSRRWSALIAAALLLSACSQGEEPGAAPGSAQSSQQDLPDASIAPVQAEAVDTALTDLRKHLDNADSLPDENASRALKSVCASHLAGITDDEIRRSLSEELTSSLGKKPSGATAEAIATAARTHMCPD